MTYTLTNNRKTTPMQTQGVDMISDWYVNRRQLYYERQTFFLSGFAGTGKTTIVEAMIKYMSLTPDNTVIVSTTGKATLVLNDKLKKYTDMRAVTIHSLLYYPSVITDLVPVGNPQFDDTTEVELVEERSLQFSMKDRHKQLDNITLIIVDEASMLNDKLYRDLLSFGIQVLFIGDVAQLPPVKSKVVLSNPDYELTEVLRQGDDSKIAELAEYVRNTGLLWPPGIYGKDREVQIMTRAQFNENKRFRQSAIMHADQVICGLNKTRQALNQEARGYYGFDSVTPVAGDKLICLKNNKNIQINGIYAVNGQIGVVDSVVDHIKPKRRRKQSDAPIMMIDFKADGAKYSDLLEIHQSPFEMAARGEKVDPYDLDDSPGYFDYGYAITCHKAQGSEWDNVLIFAEAWHQDTRKAWLYTAITRASEKLILVV